MNETCDYQMVQFQIINTSTSVLTAEGVEIATNGSHEARVWAALPLKGQGEPMTVPDLQVCRAFFPASAVVFNAKVCHLDRVEGFGT